MTFWVDVIAISSLCGRVFFFFTLTLKCMGLHVLLICGWNLHSSSGGPFCFKYEILNITATIVDIGFGVRLVPFITPSIGEGNSSTVHLIMVVLGVGGLSGNGFVW